MKLISQTKKVHFNDNLTIFTNVLKKYHNYTKYQLKKIYINKYLCKIERKLKEKNILSEHEFFDCKIIKTN